MFNNRKQRNKYEENISDEKKKAITLKIIKSEVDRN